MKVEGFLQNDSPLGQCIGTILDMCGLNVLWLICCLPVVTVGASTCGLYYALSKRGKSDESVYQCFFRAFRGNFKQASMLWMLLLIVGLSLTASVWIVSTFSATARTVVIGLLCIPAVLLLIITGYGFTLLSQFEVKSVLTLIADSVMLGIAFFPVTIQVIALILLPIVLVTALPVIFICVIFIWLPCGFSVTAFLIQKRLEPVLEQIRNDHNQ